jgi:hypothetical protein
MIAELLQEIHGVKRCFRVGDNLETVLLACGVPLRWSSLDNVPFKSRCGLILQTMVECN